MEIGEDRRNLEHTSIAIIAIQMTNQLERKTVVQWGYTNDNIRKHVPDIENGGSNYRIFIFLFNIERKNDR